MRRAPAVAVECDGSTGWRALQSALYGLAAAHAVAWLAAWAEWPMPWRLGATLAAGAACALLAVRALRAPPVRLAWDGERWTLGPGAEPGRLALMIDLGDWLLLHYRFDAPPGAARWLTVSAGTAGGTLHALRVALYGAPSLPTDRVRAPERQAD